MSRRLILGLTGFPGTGKSTTAAYLSERHGFRIFEGSTWLRETAAEQGLTLDARESYEAFFRAQQAERGLSCIADAMLKLEGDRLLECGHRRKP